MSIILTEKRNSRSSTENPKSATLRYTLTGSTSETMARAYCRAATVAIYRGLFRQNIHLDPAGLGIWNVETTYGPYVGKEPTAGDFRWTFDTTGGTMHITNAIEHLNDYGTDPPDHGGAIGVNSDGDVEGCDIGTSNRKWSETWQLSADSIGFNYGDIIEELTFTTNAATFRGKPAGYVLFMGATGGGSNKDPDIIELTFNFATGIALTSETICGISGVSKLPWEYLWYEYSKTTATGDAKKKVKKLIAIHREKVFESGDFSLLGIGTGATPG
jgi:hypothetical protein